MGLFVVLGQKVIEGTPPNFGRRVFLYRSVVLIGGSVTEIGIVGNGERFISPQEKFLKIRVIEMTPPNLSRRTILDRWTFPVRPSVAEIRGARRPILSDKKFHRTGLVALDRGNIRSVVRNRVRPTV